MTIAAPSPTSLGTKDRQTPTLVNVLRDLMPYMWPPGRRDLRIEVVLACVSLIAAKIVTVLMPYAYKGATDWLTHAAGASTPEATIGLGLAIVPAMLIISYGVARVMMMILNQLRDVLFTRVSQNAVRNLTTRTFRHLHDLSLRFHIERRTGAISRIIEKGNGAVDSIIRLGIMTSLPTALELLLICYILWHSFGFVYVLLVLAMVVAYLWYTVKASEWRIGIRRELNESDRDACS